MTVKAVCIRYVIFKFTYFIIRHMYFLKILVNVISFIITILYSANILRCIWSNTENREFYNKPNFIINQIL